jgi:hypothetical protein
LGASRGLPEVKSEGRFSWGFGKPFNRKERKGRLEKFLDTKDTKNEEVL